jgi:hypothetical protein
MERTFAYGSLQWVLSCALGCSSTDPPVAHDAGGDTPTIELDAESGDGDACITPPASETLVCEQTGSPCPVLPNANETLSSVRSFQGEADEAILADPSAPGRLWMVYTRLDGKVARSATGMDVGVPHTATQLSRSDDSGASFTLVTSLWDSPLTEDPEMLGPPGFFESETASLAVDPSGSVTWFSVRLHYFMPPTSAYAPRYATGWTVRVAAADSPANLA